jgi:hypothetical protein
MINIYIFKQEFKIDICCLNLKIHTLSATVVYSDKFETSTVSFLNNFNNMLGCIWLKVITIYIYDTIFKLLPNIFSFSYLVNATKKSETASRCPFVNILFLDNLYTVCNVASNKLA